jgi:hypothetical protein
VVKLVDTPDLGSGAARYVGSSPILGIFIRLIFLFCFCTAAYSLHCHPIDLVVPERGDIMAKYIYARHREMQVDSNWALDLYASHLRVWNGFYEGNPYRDNLADFIRDFHTLLNSIKEEGFDPNRSVLSLNSHGEICNGSHRVASCLLYNRDLVCIPSDCDGIRPFWSLHYFRLCGLEEKYLDAMALQYCELKKDTYIVHLFPAAAEDEYGVQCILKKHGSIVYRKEIWLNAEGAVNLIKGLYEGEGWLGTAENDFWGARWKANHCFPKEQIAITPLRVYLFSCPSPEEAVQCKRKIRALFDLGNHSVHVNDTHAESVVIARTVFNQNSIHLLNTRKPGHFKTFETLLKKYKAWIKENDADSDCFCIDGSATLAAYGLRDCRDLDYLQHGYDDLPTPPPDVHNHHGELKHHVFTKDDIIFNSENHFYYQGIKIATLSVVKAMKRNRNEPKDITDIKLVDALLLDSYEENTFNPSVCAPND